MLRWSCQACAHSRYDYVDKILVCECCGRKESWRSWKLRSEAAEKRQADDAREADRLWEMIPDDMMLRRLMQLCHPDKHGNSEASKIATLWLLGLRQERQKAA